MAANPFAEFAAPQANPFEQFVAAPAPPPTGMPGQRKSPSALTQFGRSVASLADTTVGGVLPGAVQYLAYPFARVGRSDLKKHKPSHKTSWAQLTNRLAS